MSMIGSLLAFVVLPLKAKVAQPAPPNAEAWEAALDHWRNAYEVLWRENSRLCDERDAALRTLERLSSSQELAQQRQEQQMAQYQAQWAQTQNAYNQQALGQGLGQQAQWGEFCNCVPARADMLSMQGGQIEYRRY